MYQHLFGPVPSRRLGMSLGVDLVPHKVCTFNCIYCECGATTELTVERKEYVSVDVVIAELSRFLAENPTPDFATFSGAGEPTLNSRIGEVLRFLKSDPRGLPVAVLTNGSLLSDPEVRAQLLPADVVLPSLDAASERCFRRIDRPFRTLDLATYVQGLVDFRREFRGRMWLEVMIIPGYNDTPEELRLLKETLLRIAPDRIQLNTLDRPGAVSNLKAAGRDVLSQIIADWGLDNTEIIAAAPDRKTQPSYRKDTETAILETIARRPCTLEDLVRIVGAHVNEINKYLGVLEGEGRIETVQQDRGLFYQLRAGRPS